ncbi:hypothetical protein BDR06DRAFT_415457 [Suillus hirtellus]|nr:hypothetical protein BDR06DRAFT_415457 [Suillus hirtellus]
MTVGIGLRTFEGCQCAALAYPNISARAVLRKWSTSIITHFSSHCLSLVYCSEFHNNLQLALSPTRHTTCCQHPKNDGLFSRSSIISILCQGAYPTWWHSIWNLDRDDDADADEVLGLSISLVCLSNHPGSQTRTHLALFAIASRTDSWFIFEASSSKTS